MMAPTPQYPSMAAVIMAYCKAEKNGDDLSNFVVEGLNNDAHSELMKMAEKRKCKVRKATLSSATITRGASRGAAPVRSSVRSATPRAVSISAASKTIVKSGTSSSSRTIASKLVKK